MSQPSSAVEMYTLHHVVKGVDKPTKAQFTGKKPFQIGSGAGVMFKVSHAAGIMEAHAEIFRAPGCALTIKSLQEGALVSVNGVRINEPHPIVAGDIITIGTKLMLRISLVESSSRHTTGEKSGSADGSVNKSKDSTGSELSGPVVPAAPTAPSSTRELRPRSPTKKTFSQRLEDAAASDDSAKDSMSIVTSPRSSSPTRGTSALTPLEAIALPEAPTLMGPPPSPPRSPRRSPPRSPVRSPPRSPLRSPPRSPQRHASSKLRAVALPGADDADDADADDDDDERASMSLSALSDKNAPSSQDISSQYSSPPPSGGDSGYTSPPPGARRRGRPSRYKNKNPFGVFIHRSLNDDSGADDEMESSPFSLPQGVKPLLESAPEEEEEEEEDEWDDNICAETQSASEAHGRTRRRRHITPRGRPRKRPTGITDFTDGRSRRRNLPKQSRSIRDLMSNHRFIPIQEKLRTKSSRSDTDTPSVSDPIVASVPVRLNETSKRGRKRKIDEVSDSKPVKRKTKRRKDEPDREDEPESTPSIARPASAIPLADSNLKSLPGDLGVPLAAWITSAIPPGGAITKEQLAFMVGMKVTEAINACVTSGLLSETNGALKVAAADPPAPSEQPVPE